MNKKQADEITYLVTEAKSFEILSKSQLKAFSRAIHGENPDTRMLKLKELYGSTIEAAMKKHQSSENEYSEEELNLVLKLKNKEKKSYKEISEITGRSIKSLQTQINEWNKKNNNVGSRKFDEIKWSNNKNFLDSFGPGEIKSVLDVFAGRKHWWKSNTNSKINVISNDINLKISDLNFHYPASHLLYNLEDEGWKFDIVDLDPYDSPSELDIIRALGIAQKGIIFTFGDRRAYQNAEMRLVNSVEFVNSALEHYHVNYTPDNIIEFIKSHAKKLGKKLIQYNYYSNGSIWRVYFKIVPESAEVLTELANELAQKVKRFREMAAEDYRKRAEKMEALAKNDI